jgi:quercetin dioxygenase-like cupin family protein
MSKAGDTVENPVTGERVVVRVGTEDSGGELLVNEGLVRPGGAVVGEHVHPTIEETFEVLSGRLNFRIDGRESVAGPGERLRVPAGVAHDWWNAGEEEAHVVVEIRPGARFEETGLNLFGLARGGRTNRKGMPNPLQAAVFAREFSDVFHFTRPRWPSSGRCSAPWRRSPGLWVTGAATRGTAGPLGRGFRAVIKGTARRPRRGWRRGRLPWRPRRCWRPCCCSGAAPRRDLPVDRPYSPECLEWVFSELRL